MLDIVKLAEFIEEKLNVNSQGIIFRTYTYEKTLDKRYETDSQGTKTEFVPSIITTPIGSYLPMNDVRGMRLSFNVEILLPYKYKDEWIDMLEDFVYELNGKIFYYGRDTKVFYEAKYDGATEKFTVIKMSCQVPTFGAVGPQNFEVIRDIATYLPISKTENYIAINIPISIKTSENIHIGDEASLSIANVGTTEWATSTSTVYDSALALGKLYVGVSFANQAAFHVYVVTNYPISSTLYSDMKAPSTTFGTFYYEHNASSPYLLEFYKLKPIDKGDQNQRLLETNHLEGDATSVTIIKENATSWSTNVYYESGIAILDTLAYEIATGDNMNHKYWVKKIMPNGLAVYRLCVLSSDSASYPTDDFATLPLTFMKAMV